jgi:hypothetical protein
MRRILGMGQSNKNRPFSYPSPIKRMALKRLYWMPILKQVTLCFLRDRQMPLEKEATGHMQCLKPAAD